MKLRKSPVAVMKTSPPPCSVVHVVFISLCTEITHIFINYSSVLRKNFHPPHEAHMFLPCLMQGTGSRLQQCVGLQNVASAFQTLMAATGVSVH